MGRFTAAKAFQTKEEYVFETLRAAILDLRLAPGEKLVVDRLSQEIGVSPIPIRTALQRLEGEGLVRIVPFTGTVVADVTLQEVDEIFSILEALERIAFEAAARTQPMADNDDLDQILAALDQAAADQDNDRWSSLNREFHQKITEMSGMKILAEFTRRAFDRWDRLRRFYFRQGLPGRIATAQRDHHKMVALLRSGDAAGLSQIVGEHNRAARMAYHLKTE